MRQLSENLWVGNAGDLREPRGLFAAGIAAVVELADNEPFAVLPRELIRLHLPLSDGGMNPEWLLRLAVQTVAALITAKVATLICCSCGLNRSLCLAAAGIAVADGTSFEAALLETSRSGPADISPRLLAEFRAIMPA
jgi:protein-tyrosine phosphatase